MEANLKKSLVMQSMKLLYVLLAAFLFIVCWKAYYLQHFHISMLSAYSMVICILYVALIVLLGRIYHAFDLGIYSVSQLAYSLCLADLLGAGITYAAICISQVRFVNPLPLLGLLAVQGAWCAAWSLMANRLYVSLHAPKAAVLVYRQKSNLRKLEEIKCCPHEFNVQKYIENPADIHQLIAEVQGYDVIFVADVETTLRNGIAKYCLENNVQGYFLPSVDDVITAGARHMQMFCVPIMRVCRADPSPTYLFVKRLFDIIASAVMIVVLSPLMLAIATAVKLCDGGPVLYKQVRLTRDGKTFPILKFRSMCPDAEKAGVARLASTNDARITPIGRVLRAIRLDELPQLFNILKGDMTIVGPRPERPEIARQYERIIPSFSLRLQVKAGLTGYAQVYGKYNTEPYEKLQMDLMYINRMSVMEDLMLMLATVKILFIKERTTGVEEQQIIAMENPELAHIEIEQGLKQ